MREWWANVYPPRSGVITARAVDRGEAIAWAAEAVSNRNMPPVCRIHVRLKPEGAPRRYASEANRLAWEADPVAAKEFADKGWPPECLALFML
jgi:hypothetical protein